MLHASATRAATRRPFPVRPRATGHHRLPSARSLALREPERTMHLVMTGIGALIMLGICGLSSFFIIADERRGLGAPDTGITAVAAAPYAISSRVIDPEPLTLAEVFSATDIRLRSGDDAYRVTMTHVDTDCETATTGRLGEVLAAHGCSQVVRAAMTAPYGGYRVTVGVFNLADAEGAAAAGALVRPLVESGEGSFAAMAAGAAPGQDPLARPDSQVGWHDRGHYLMYCVISRPDNAAVQPDDPYARRITADLIDNYLAGEVLGARALNL